MQISYNETAEFLRNNDNFYILTHASPDGDTVGSGFGLCYMLRKIGKKANVLCSDDFPKRYDFMYKEYAPMKFSPDTIVAVDVADKKLLGNNLSQYSYFVDLCIDHHISNTGYAKRTLVEPDAAAACQIIYQLAARTGLAEFDRNIAQCLYTGIATDTGCFKFDCTSPETHIAAAELMRYDIPAGKINRRMFDEKSKGRMKVEQYVINTMEYYLDDKCSISAVTLEEMEKEGLKQEDLEGIAGISTMLESIEVGIVIRQKDTNKFKVSMRSTGDVDVSEICKKFDGGGHVKAAGCTLEGDLNEIKRKLLAGVAPALGIDLWLA